MKETRGNFRLYPYDTSMYSFSSRQVAEHLDLLSMAPVIGKLKEDSFECHSAYIHKQKPINGKRTYIEEDAGILAVKNNKRFLIALNMSGSNDKTKLLKICPEWVDKRIIESGDSSPFYDDYGICHVGMEYFLGNSFS